MIKKFAYSILATVGLLGILALTPLGATAQQTIRNVTLGASSAVIGAVTQSGTWDIGNLSELGGTAISMNAGTVGDGVQRVTLATDDASAVNIEDIEALLSAGIDIKIAGSDPLAEVSSATLQNAATADGNGSLLTVNGYSSVLLTSNCATCSGGTTINFEASEDGTNFVAVRAQRIESPFTIATSTAVAGLSYWRVSTAGFQYLRARVSAYSAGTVTVTGRAVFGPFTLPSNDIAHDDAASSRGPQGMLEAVSDMSANTAVADGDAVRQVGDLLGRSISAGPCDRAARVRSVTTITDGSSTSAISAGGAGIYLEVWDVIIANSSATAVTVDIRDGTAGSVLATFPVPANTAGVVHRFSVPLTGSANTAVAVDPSASATSIITTLSGCKVK